MNKASTYSPTYFSNIISTNTLQAKDTSGINSILYQPAISKTLIFVALLMCFVNIQQTKAQNIKGLSKYDTTLMSIHSPAKASFYSAVFPGLGQIYNKKYWKAPILYAGIGGLVYAISIHNDLYSRYKQAYLIKISNDPNAKVEKLFEAVTKERLRQAMDQRRRWRDLCVLSLAGVYLANVIDATVDAYLFDYDVSQDLSLRIEPAVFQTPSNTSLGLSCKFKF